MRDLLAQKEQAERNVTIFATIKRHMEVQNVFAFLLIASLMQRVAETLDADVRRWSSGKEGNLRALLSTLQYVCVIDLLLFWQLRPFYTHFKGILRIIISNPLELLFPTFSFFISATILNGSFF